MQRRIASTKKPSNPKRLLRFLARNRGRISPLLILTHDFPDPDAIASAFALNHIAERVYRIRSRIAYGGIIGRMENREMVRLLKIPVHKLKAGDLKRYSNVAIVDSQPAFQNNPFPRRRRATMVVDQHASVEKPDAEFAVVDTECGATSVIMAQALLAMKVKIPERLATALAYGILSDTLDLYRAKRADVIQTYLKIIAHCDLKALARIQNPSRSRRFFATLGKSIQNAMARRRLIVAHMGTVGNPDVVAQVADFLLTYKGMNWAFCTGRFNDKLHVSLRAANPNSPAGDILRDIFPNRKDAGGHGTIAGGSLRVRGNGTDEMWKSAEDALLQKLVRRIRIPVKGEFYYPFRQDNS